MRYYQGRVCLRNRPRSIYQYSNMVPTLSGQNYKFLSFFCLSIPKRDLATKKTTPNMEVCPKSHVRILIYRTWTIVNYGYSVRIDNDKLLLNKTFF